MYEGRDNHLNLQEAKKKYEANGGHYFEWFPVFGQELKEFYSNEYRTFIVECCNRYSVLGFDEDYAHVLGYGDNSGYATYEEAVTLAKRPGRSLW